MTPPIRKSGTGARPWALALSLFGLAFLTWSLWLPAKAVLAQALLEQAWAATRSGAPPEAPWPGADTRPVARLHLPQTPRPLLVLDAPGPRHMAFGPVLERHGEAIVINAHRDSHFAGLHRVPAGAMVELETRTRRQRYRVARRLILDTDQTQLMVDPARPSLILATCWPPNALTAGGSERLVLVAEPVPG